MKMREMVDAVREHAEANYEADGWDYVVECYSRKDLEEIIGSATTEKGAIEAVGEVVGTLNERREDVQGLIW